MGDVHLRALAELQLAQRGGECRREFAEQDAGDHAQENPDGQVTLKERETLGIYDFGFTIYDFRHGVGRGGTLTSFFQPQHLLSARGSLAFCEPQQGSLESAGLTQAGSRQPVCQPQDCLMGRIFDFGTRFHRTRHVSLRHSELLCFVIMIFQAGFTVRRNCRTDGHQFIHGSRIVHCRRRFARLNFQAGDVFGGVCVPPADARQFSGKAGLPSRSLPRRIWVWT